MLLDLLRLSRAVGEASSGKLTATDHAVIMCQSSVTDAVRVLRSHGIPSTSLHDVFRATVVAKVTPVQRQIACDLTRF